MALPCQSTGPGAGSRESENGHVRASHVPLGTSRPCQQEGQPVPPGSLLMTWSIWLQQRLLPEVCGYAPAPHSGFWAPIKARDVAKPGTTQTIANCPALSPKRHQQVRWMNHVSVPRRHICISHKLQRLQSFKEKERAPIILSWVVFLIEFRALRK